MGLLRRGRQISATLSLKRHEVFERMAGIHLLGGLQCHVCGHAGRALDMACSEEKVDGIDVFEYSGVCVCMCVRNGGKLWAISRGSFK